MVDELVDDILGVKSVVLAGDVVFPVVIVDTLAGAAGEFGAVLSGARDPLPPHPAIANAVVASSAAVTSFVAIPSPASSETSRSM